MKKRKILVLFPLLGLFLSGCTFQEGLAATKSFIGDKIYHPLKDWFNGITGKKEEQKSDTSDEKTLTEVAFKSAPKSVKVGTQLDASLVKLTATYSDKSTAEVSAEKVTVDTSKVATGVKGVAEYKGKTAEFTIDVVDGSTPSGDTEHAGTLEDPYTVSDAKVIFDGLEPRGNSQEVYVTGVIAAEPAPKVNASNRGEFYLGDGVCETNLYVYNINDIGGGTFANADKLMVGSTVVAKGAIKKFVSGEDNIFELCYVSNVASCELVSLTPPAGKEIVSLIPGSAVGIPESIVQDEPINLNKITIGVNYQDGSTGTAHPDRIELDSSTPVDNVPGKLFVGSLEYDFTINVTEKVAPSGSIVFPLGEDGTAEHADGNTASEFSETVSGQTISLSNGQKMYLGARDATGNGCLKFGTSSAGGSFDLSVSEFGNLEKVIFRVAQYKSRNDGTIAINGGDAYTMQKTSDAGQYDDVEVAITNQTKLSVVFAKRAMLNEIELVFEDTTPVVAVESVEISPSSLELDVSDSPAPLTANVLPVDATDKTVSWHSNDESVATVSADGLVTPVGSGSTTIIASAGGVESNACSVTVTTHVTGVSITPTLNLAEGDTGNVVVTVAPANADDASYTLSSSNTSVAEVDANGVVTAVSAGEATITATTTDGGYTADCVVTVSSVSIPVESVELVGNSSRSMVVGDELDLEAHGAPSNATEDKGVTWDLITGSSVSITPAGHVTALAEGDATVRAYSVAHNSLYVDVLISVSKVAVSSVSLNKPSTTITEGNTETLLATVLPEDATYPEVTWSSSDDSIAEVDQNGVVTAVSEGEATITALADGQSATCVVTVEAASAVNTVQLAYEGAIAGNTDPFTFDGTVVSITGKSYVLQDGAYAINIYNKETANLALGKLVHVVSTLKLYNGCPQTDSITSAEVTGDGVPQTSAPVTNKADLDALNHNVLAHVDDAVFVSKNGDWASGSSKQFVFDIGGNNITVQFDKQGYDAAKAAIANAAIAGAHYELTGLVTAAYSGNNQFTFTGTSGIVKTADAPAADPSSVSITTTASTLEVGKTLTLEATVSPANAPQDITWNIEEGGAYATLSGNVLTGVADGDVKVRATATGFASVYAEKTITVSSAAPVKKYATKVTSVSEIVSGAKYYIGYENNGNSFIFNGTDAVSDYESAVVTSSGIEQTDSLISVEISTMTDGYSLKVVGGTNNGKFMSGTSGSNKLNFVATAQLNTISITDGLATIISNTSELVYNSTSGQTRFRYYKPATVAGDATHYLRPCIYILAD